MIELSGTSKNNIKNIGEVEASAATGRDGLLVYLIISKKQNGERLFVAMPNT